MAEVTTHTTKKKFVLRPHLLARRAVDHERWRFRQDGPVFYGTGPCPQCHAPDQHGSTTVRVTLQERFPDGALIEAWAAPRPDLQGPDDAHPDIVVDCECGSEHGVAGATGCGAVWVVTWQER